MKAMAKKSTKTWILAMLAVAVILFVSYLFFATFRREGIEIGNVQKGDCVETDPNDTNTVHGKVTTADNDGIHLDNDTSQLYMWGADQTNNLKKVDCPSDSQQSTQPSNPSTQSSGESQQSSTPQGVCPFDDTDYNLMAQFQLDEQRGDSGCYQEFQQWALYNCKNADGTANWPALDRAFRRQCKGRSEKYTQDGRTQFSKRLTQPYPHCFKNENAFDQNKFNEAVKQLNEKIKKEDASYCHFNTCRDKSNLGCN